MREREGVVYSLPYLYLSGAAAAMAAAAVAAVVVAQIVYTIQTGEQQCCGSHLNKDVTISTTATDSPQFGILISPCNFFPAQH